MWNTWPNAAIALASLLTFGFVAEHDALHPIDRSGEVELVDMPDEFTDMVNWAVDLFDEADLTLPPLRFTHHGNDRSFCAGRRGSHRSTDGQSTINICTRDSSQTIAALVLHETAHAWAAHDLSDQRKTAFQSLRGWTYWRNHREADWHENGSEQAAEIILWGLIDRPVGIITISQHGCDDLDAGYRALTGRAPLHGYRDLC